MDHFSGKSPSNVSDDHLRAIGAVMVNWTVIEFVMEAMILGLYEINPDRGLVLTSNLSFQNKLTILRVLALRGAIKDATEAQFCVDLLKRIEDAHVERNKVAHGLWTGSKVQGVARRMAIRVRGRRLTTIDEKVSLSELEGVAATFLVVSTDLTRLAERLGVHPNMPRDTTSEE
jgi:hypothetical protein